MPSPGVARVRVPLLRLRACLHAARPSMRARERQACQAAPRQPELACLLARSAAELTRVHAGGHASPTNAGAWNHVGARARGA